MEKNPTAFQPKISGNQLEMKFSDVPPYARHNKVIIFLAILGFWGLGPGERVLNRFLGVGIFRVGKIFFGKFGGY